MTQIEHPPLHARIGLLVPSSNAVMEVEFYRSLPSDITVHTSHILRSTQGVDADGVRETARNAVDAARSMADAELSLIVHGHTASSYIDGPAGDADIARNVAAAARAPGMTTAGAVVRLLNFLGARRIWFAAPYPVATTQTGADFLAAHGFDVRSMHCLGVSRGPDLKRVPAQASYDLCMRAAAGTEADALFMSGTGVRTMAIVGPLEQALGKPVITSNLAALYCALDTLGHGKRFAFGESRLLEWLARAGKA